MKSFEIEQGAKDNLSVFVHQANGIVNVSYNMVYDMIRNYAYREEIKKKYTSYIGLHRAGTLLACMMAVEYGKDIKVYKVDRGYDEEEIKKLKNNLKGQNVLLVDDVVGTGKSMQEILDGFKDSNVKVDTFALVTDPKRNNLNLTYKMLEMDAWVMLPWDVIDCKSEFKERKIAFDMDGLICSNLDSKLDKYMFWNRYIGNVWAQVRRLFVKSLVKGEFIYPITIITGRPMIDRFVTKLWLKMHGIKAIVYMNPYGIDYADNWKLECIKKLDLTMFIESESNVVEKLVKGLEK